MPNYYDDREFPYLINALKLLEQAPDALSDVYKELMARFCAYFKGMKTTRDGYREYRIDSFEEDPFNVRYEDVYRYYHTGLVKKGTVNKGKEDGHFNWKTLFLAPKYRWKEPEYTPEELAPIPKETAKLKKYNLTDYFLHEFPWHTLRETHPFLSMQMRLFLGMKIQPKDYGVTKALTALQKYETLEEEAKALVDKNEIIQAYYEAATNFWDRYDNRNSSLGQRLRDDFESNKIGEATNSAFRFVFFSEKQIKDAIFFFYNMYLKDRRLDYYSYSMANDLIRNLKFNNKNVISIASGYSSRKEAPRIDIRLKLPTVHYHKDGSTYLVDRSFIDFDTVHAKLKTVLENYDDPMITYILGRVGFLPKPKAHPKFGDAAWLKELNDAYSEVLPESEVEIIDV